MGVTRPIRSTRVVNSLDGSGGLIKDHGDVNFEEDAFISYAHLDDVELVEGHKGWVANLHLALKKRVAQLYGQEPRIWRDPKLDGNDYFADTLVERLQHVKAVIAIVSPRYVKSEWGRREITAFCEAAEHQFGIRVQNKARIFKVLKTPVARELHPPELQGLLGYEFFKKDEETGKMRELDAIFGPQAETEFWLKLDDLAYDVCELLKIVPPPVTLSAPSPAGGAVYVALTTSELNEQREAIRRDLVQHGYTVLPDRPLPLAAADVQAAIRDDLARCRMSIHMIGKTYSMVPEGGLESLSEIQYELAVERASKGQFSRLVWMPPGLLADDQRQRKVIEELRMDPRVQHGADLLETPLEDLRTMIGTWLNDSEKPREAPAPATVGAPPQLYLIYDQRDAGVISPWADFLFKDFEVIHPTFDGDEAEIREYHEENLRTCSGALIFYGAANEVWLRRKLREVQKSAGYGRTKAKSVVGICLIAPKAAEKERFRTHEALILPQWDGLSPEELQPFVSALKERGALEDDGTDSPI